MTAPRFSSIALPFALCAALLLLGGCARPAGPGEIATDFWRAVVDARDDDALAVALPGDEARRRLRMETLAANAAEVEALEVPAEAEVALLPTRLTRGSGDGALVVDTVTVLRRVDAHWRVDLEGTAEAVRGDAGAALGRRLEDSVGRLGESLGQSADDLAAELDHFAALLGEELAEERDALASNLASELERGAAAVAEGLAALEQALREARSARRDAPPDDAPPER